MMLDGGGPFYVKHFLSKPDVLDKITPGKSVMEMCAGIGALGKFLADKFNLREVYVDVDPNVAHHYKDKDFYLSDAFDNYDGDKVDTIVLNPPHVTSIEEFNTLAELKPDNYPTDTVEREQRSKLILLDEDFDFHRRFCRDAHKYLNLKGQILFFENRYHIHPERIKKELGSLYSFSYLKSKEVNKEGHYLLIATYERVLS